MTWRVTICLGDTNSKNDVFFLSMFPLPAVGCWHDWIPGEEKSGEGGRGQAADPVWQWSWIPRSWAGREFAINSVCKMKQCCHFCLILELAWILLIFACWQDSSRQPSFTKNEGICFNSAGKLQFFLLEGPVYGKICFPGKAEIEQLNLSVSWRSAIVGSWLRGTWNEKWGVSFLDDWLGSVTRKGNLLFMAPSRILWSFLNFCSSWCLHLRNSKAHKYQQPYQRSSIKLRDASSAIWDLVWEMLLRKDEWSPVSFFLYRVF